MHARVSRAHICASRTCAQRGWHLLSCLFFACLCLLAQPRSQSAALEPRLGASSTASMCRLRHCALALDVSSLWRRLWTGV
eukprot:407319-Alexandrium_andersonii.AAC.1